MDKTTPQVSVATIGIDLGKKVLEPFREVSIHDEAAVNRRSMRRIIARRMKAAAFRA
jgi:hypothetical protein